MSTIEKVFAPLYGKLAWNVKKGIGSFLTFEFGEPHFVVLREPIESNKPVSQKLQRHWARRLVAIRGDWHLWIYCCDWQYLQNERSIGSNNSSAKEINEIALDLNGQALKSMTIEPSGKTVFQFDLGGRIETTPNITDYDDKEQTEQWFLYEPSGGVLTLRADRFWSYAPGNDNSPKQWYPLGYESA